MMRLLIDVNIMMDALVREARPDLDQEREAATHLLELVAEGRIKGVVTSSGLSIVVHYLQRYERQLGKAVVHQIINRLLDTMQWAPMHPEHFRAALDHPIKDIEDAAQLIAAQATGKIDAVVSRDKDFAVKGVKVLTAAQAVRRLKR